MRGLFPPNIYRDGLQAIGLLVGMEDVPLQKQADYLSSLLTPLCQQVLATFAASIIFFRNFFIELNSYFFFLR